jgi:hypothetical protein
MVPLRKIESDDEYNSILDPRDGIFFEDGGKWSASRILTQFQV